MIIYWVEDFLSKDVIEQKFYSTKAEAVDRRNELGYGIVRWWDTDNPKSKAPIIPH